MFSDKERARRLNATAGLIRDEELQAIWITGNGTVATNDFGCYRYFTDCRVSFYVAGAVITPQGDLIGVAKDENERQTFYKETFVKEAVINRDQVAGAAEILRSKGITKGRIGVLTDVLPSAWKHRMLEYIPGLEFVDVSDQVFALRTVKSMEEIETQRICAKIADAGYAAICEASVPGARESEIVAAGNYAMQKMGMEQSFMLISSGRFSIENNTMQLLHHTSSIDNVLSKGDSVALEMTPRYNGYWTQIVRTISVGAPNPDLEEFVRVTRGTIEAGKKVMKAGIPISEMVAEMDRYAVAEGYRLREPMGHICAVDLNEERVSKNNQRLLTPGMCVILHPTVVSDQVPNGIFWGESYIVTDTGYETIMSSSTELYVS
ncbi:MAG: aminopeptidase P family protein [Eubacteriaceae bacterium]|nr:aminopeptidase P family protein [Eubacteriaceae bacterium]